MPPKYKEYQNKYVPRQNKIGDYEPYDFDPDAYPDEPSDNLKLRQYISELEPYVKHLLESARLRQLHFERTIEARGVEEEGRHRHFRIQFGLIADLAQEKLCHYNTVYGAKLEERALIREKWREVKRAKGAKIDYEAQSTETSCRRRNVAPPRVTRKMVEQRKREREQEQKMREERDNTMFREETKRNQQEEALFRAVMPSEITVGPGCEFWSKIQMELTDSLSCVDTDNGRVLQTLQHIGEGPFVYVCKIPEIPEELSGLPMDYAECVMQQWRPTNVLEKEITFLTAAPSFIIPFLLSIASIGAETNRFTTMQRRQESVIWMTPIFCALASLSFQQVSDAFELYFQDVSKNVPGNGDVLDTVASSTSDSSEESDTNDVCVCCESCGRNQKVLPKEVRALNDALEFLKRMWTTSITHAWCKELTSIAQLVRKGKNDEARSYFQSYAHKVNTAIPRPMIGTKIAKEYLTVAAPWIEKELIKVRQTLRRYQKAGKLPRYAK